MIAIMPVIAIVPMIALVIRVDHLEREYGSS